VQYKTAIGVSTALLECTLQENIGAGSKEETVMVKEMTKSFCNFTNPA
jgi:hypothetical protein